MGGGWVRADPRRGLVLRGLRKVMPVSGDHDGMRFLTRRGGRLSATPLLVALVALAALVAIEATDVVFAADSIPAAFGVTTVMFIVFTSNALRSSACAPCTSSWPVRRSDSPTSARAWR